jgi:hypothetical protein
MRFMELGQLPIHLGPLPQAEQSQPTATIKSIPSLGLARLQLRLLERMRLLVMTLLLVVVGQQLHPLVMVLLAVVVLVVMQGVLQRFP